ncbi:hypothetical protein AZA_89993 [Nitrospirillum viridazoti Y2]|nr:hypothetical protein AZA_89993 [Nitrospirillum amazonense Y2]
MVIGISSFIFVLFFLHILNSEDMGVYIEDSEQSANVIARQFVEESEGTGDIYISINNHDPTDELKSAVTNNESRIRNISDLIDC